MQMQWALITGASSGIGESFAHRAAAEGVNLVLVARRYDRLKVLAEKLSSQHGIQCHIFDVDLSVNGAAEKLAQKVRDKNIEVDLLFNNAGFGSHGEFLDISLQKQQEMIDLNMRALVDLCYVLGRSMCKRKSGIIINNASVAGFTPTPYYAVYGATKAFVLSFSQAIGKEWARDGVSVTALCPGATESEFVTVSGFKGNIRKVAPVQTSQAVADYAWTQALRKRSVAVSGLPNRLSMFAVKFAPRFLSLAVTARVFGMRRN